MLHLGIAIPQQADGKRSMEEAAQALCKMFYDSFVDSSGKRACALVRFYKTQSYSELPAALQSFVSRSLAPLSPRADTNCLTLLATVGDQPAWNSRQRSKGHQAIALASPEVIEGAPMIAQLIKQFGVDVRQIVRSGTKVVQDLKGRNYGVFYVPKAKGSPYIPAQDDFVLPYEIESVLGFGGTLASGDLFAVILFSKAAIPESVTDQFRRLAADIRIVISKYPKGAIFS